MITETGRKKQRLWKRDGGCCHYCGTKLSWQEKTIDHVIPRSKGGSNRTWNLVISCRPCNEDKADRDPCEKLLEMVLMRMRSHQMYIMLLRSRFTYRDDRDLL